MKIKSLLSMLLFSLIINNVLCQGVNNEYYRFGAQPACIPVQLEEYNSNSRSLFFGVSDPGLDSVTAIVQAYKRAQALACMAQGVLVKNYTTGFLSEAYQGSSGTYQSMVELTVGNSIMPSIFIIDTVFTLLEEAVLIVQIGQEFDSIGFEFSLNRFNVEYQWGEQTK